MYIFAQTSQSRYLIMIIVKKNQINAICQHVNQSLPLAYPTETVFGLGGNALSENLIQKIYDLKHREEKKPFIVLIKDIHMLKKYSVNIDQKTLLVLRHFWPGPLSVILKSKNIPKQLQNSCGETAFRHSSLKFLQTLFKKIEVPLISTSANHSGKEALFNSHDIKINFKDASLMIVEDTIKKNTLPSTLIKITSDRIELLRSGAIDFEAIKKVYASLK